MTPVGAVVFSEMTDTSGCSATPTSPQASGPEAAQERVSFGHPVIPSFLQTIVCPVRTMRGPFARREVAVVREDKLSAVLSEFARTLATDFPIQGDPRPPRRTDRRGPPDHLGGSHADLGREAHRATSRPPTSTHCASSDCRPRSARVPASPRSTRGRPWPSPISRRTLASRASARPRSTPAWPRCSRSRCGTATAGSARSTSTATRPGSWTRTTWASRRHSPMSRRPTCSTRRHATRSARPPTASTTSRCTIR